MQKRTLKPKRLTLSKETIRTMQDGELVEVGGAYPQSALSECLLCSSMGVHGGCNCSAYGTCD